VNADQNSRKLQVSPFEICNVTLHAKIEEICFLAGNGNIEAGKNC